VPAQLKEKPQSESIKIDLNQANKLAEAELKLSDFKPADKQETLSSPKNDKV